MLGYGIDILHTLSPQLPSSINSNLAPAADLTRASYYLISIGLITAIPAILTGGFEAMKMINKQGMYESDGKTIRDKVKATFAHAIANDIVIAVSAYMWYLRREQANNTLAGKLGIGSQAAYAPATWMVGTGAGITMLMMMAANIGGVLTYNFGVGFTSTGAGSKKTQ